MGKLRDKMKQDMELRHLSERTIETYLKCVENLAKHYGKPPEDIGHKAIRGFIYYLLKEKQASQASISQHFSAIKFFYQTTLGRDWGTLKIPRSKREKKLPVVLSKEEVWSVFEEIKNRPHEIKIII